MPEQLPWLAEQLGGLQDQGLLRDRRQVTPLPDGWCELDGKRLRNFGTNDYLNLAHDAQLVGVAQSALAEAGVGSRASALVVGRTGWHAHLEEQIARFEKTQAAILFPSGYAANLGTLAALADPGDVIFADRFNHASLVDGARLSGARLRVYRHDNLPKLESELDKAGSARRRVIVTDSLFSMDGDLAPLPELCDLADRYDATLVVDEAHASGVFGEQGRGVGEHWGVEERIPVRIGTLSKALGTLGGFVAGSQQLIDWLWNRARTQVFSTALPPALCAAACAALEIVEQEPQRRTDLFGTSAHFRDCLRSEKIEFHPTSVGPIVPIILDTPGRAVEASRQLQERGFLVPAIRPPTVPRRTSRLRISLSCAHTREDVEQLASALAETLNRSL